ncbi:MAG TPA: hypothetical protein VG754_12925 [Verrucomicrobiae bacterium]|nr:hypothetical protein [Verrucomicrobiae bacterium]
MIAVNANIVRHGKKTPAKILLPANHTEAANGSAWGLVIAGGLLLVAAGFIGLLVVML